MVTRVSRSALLSSFIACSGGFSEPEHVYHIVNVPFVVEPRDVNLYVPFENQEMSKWCALATTQSIAESFGLTISQCRLADMRANFPEGTCCYDPSNELCNVGTFPEQQLELFRNLGIDANVIQTLDESKLVEQLIHGKPVVSTVYDPISAHSFIVNGFVHDDEMTLLRIIDPGGGFKKLSYVDLTTNYWIGRRTAISRSFVDIVPANEGLGVGPVRMFGRFDPTAFSDDDMFDGPMSRYSLSYVHRPVLSSNPTDEEKEASILWNSNNESIASFAEQIRSDAIESQRCTLVRRSMVNCCSVDSSFLWVFGFTDEVDIVSSASKIVAGGKNVVETCAQPPRSWTVDASLEALGLSGLHVSRPLKRSELIRELVNGRHVLGRGEGSFTPGGELFEIQGIVSDGDRDELFLVVRHGASWKWMDYSSLVDMEQRASYDSGGWTDSWFRVRYDLE